MSWKVFESRAPAIAFDAQLGMYAVAACYLKNDALDGPPNTGWTKEQAQDFPQRMSQMIAGVSRSTSFAFADAASVGVAASQSGSISQAGSTSLFQGEATLVRWQLVLPLAMTWLTALCLSEFLRRV